MAERKTPAQKKKGALMAASVMIVLMVLYDAFIINIFVVTQELMPLGLIFVIGPSAVIIGVLIALRQRIKEIEGGEEDAAGNY